MNPVANADGKITAPAARWVYFTAKTMHATAASRSATATLYNGYCLCFDHYGHDKGIGADATIPTDDGTYQNISRLAGIVTGLPPEGKASAGWVKVFPRVPGCVVPAMVKANANANTPTFVGPTAGQFELGAVSAVSDAEDISQLVATAMETADTSTTAAIKQICFV